MKHLIISILTVTEMGYLRLAGLLFLFLLLSLLDFASITILIPLFQQMIFGKDGGATFGPEFAEFLFTFLSSLDVHVLMILTVLGFSARFVMALLVVGVIVKVVQSQRVRLGIKAIKNYLTFDYLTHTDHGASENAYLTLILTKNIVLALEALLKIVSDLIIAAILLSFLMLAEPLLFVAMVVFFGLVASGFYLLTQNTAVALGKNINQAEEQIISVTNDATKSFKEVKLLGKEGFFISKLTAEFKKVRHRTIILHILSATPRQIMEISFLFFFFGMWIIGTNQNIGIEKIIAIATAYAFVGFRLLPIATSTSSLLLKLRALEDSVMKYATHQSIKQERAIIPLADAPKGEDFRSIELKDVTFRYPKADKAVLRKISMRLERGEIVGLVGPSGVGKSTLLNIITGLIPCDKGTILLNGHAVKDGRAVWPYVGYVPQDPASVSGTLMENIAFEEAQQIEDAKQMKYVMRLAGLDKIAKKMADEADVLKLSGGQRQRIAVSRVLYHKKQLLILDEATNALDEAAERALIKAIRSTPLFGCILLVTHRTSTLKLCDRVYEISHKGINITSPKNK